MASSLVNIFRISDLGPLSQFTIEKTNYLLSSLGLNNEYIGITRTALLFFIVAIFSAILWWASRKAMILIVHQLASKSKTKWDDYLVEKRFFAIIANLIPLIAMDNFIKWFL